MRSIRRHHRERLVKSRRKWSCGHFDNAWSGIIANTPKRCSCWMCGNPRKYFKQITKQEKISTLKMIEQCEDCNIRCHIQKGEIRYADYY